MSSAGEYPDVAAVVLNWNRRDETLACLESLAASDWPDLTMIVVDNASEEEIETALAERFPDVLLVRNDSNLGFAGGMNAGIRRALETGADYLLLLNNDTVVDQALVAELVEAARERPDAGIVSPLEFFRDSPEIVSSAGLRCDLRRAYQGPPLQRGERDVGQFRGVREADASSGTAMLVPAPVVREVGLLDEALYLYIEDVDWAFRMRSTGRRVYVALGARIWHGNATSSGGEDSPRLTYYQTRNTFVVTARHAPMRGPRAAIRHCEILFANLLHALRCRRPLSNVGAVFAGWRDYIRGREGARPGDSSSVPVPKRA
jgi:GT2 family glycosyltransferase